MAAAGIRKPLVEGRADATRSGHTTPGPHARTELLGDLVLQIEHVLPQPLSPDDARLFVRCGVIEPRGETQAGTEPLVAADDYPPRSRRGADFRDRMSRIGGKIIRFCAHALNGLWSHRPEPETPKIDTHGRNRARTNPVQGWVATQVRKPQNGNHLVTAWWTVPVLRRGRGHAASSRHEQTHHGCEQSV